MIYNVSINNNRGISFQELEVEPKINKIETMCFFDFQKDRYKTTFPMLKTWNYKKPFITKQPRLKHKLVPMNKIIYIAYILSNKIETFAWYLDNGFS